MQPAAITLWHDDRPVWELIQWASEGELDAIKVFVPDDRVKLDLYSRNILTYPDRMSVFHMAAKLGNIGIAKALLDQERMNPNLDEGDSGGVAGTALHIAVRYQQFEMIDFLTKLFETLLSFFLKPQACL